MGVRRGKGADWRATRGSAHPEDAAARVAHIVLGVDIRSMLNQDADEVGSVAASAHAAHVQGPGAAGHHEVGKLFALGLINALKQCLQLRRLAVHDEMGDGGVATVFFGEL